MPALRYLTDGCDYRKGLPSDLIAIEFCTRASVGEPKRADASKQLR